MFVMSKVWNNNHSPEKVLESCQQSIEDLKCEYLDGYFVHWHSEIIMNHLLTLMIVMRIASHIHIMNLWKLGVQWKI